MQGALYQMLNHGVSTGALFLFVGFIYERRHTRMISEFGGLAKPMPWFSTLFVIASLSSIGLPFLNGFVGEFDPDRDVDVANHRLSVDRDDARGHWRDQRRFTCFGCCSEWFSGRLRIPRTSACLI